MNEDFNPIIDLCDSYKFGHFKMLPPGATRVYSYIEARGGAFPETLFFGLQPFLMKYLTTRVAIGDVEEADEFAREHGVPFHYEGWKKLVMKHGGRYPVSIRAAHEGSLVPTGNVLVDIVNTDPEFPWITSLLETALLRSVWYATTVATTSFRIKRIIKRYLEETADPEAMGGIDFKLNDFGLRGVSSLESGILGGMAHLASFKGTDNMAAVRAARRFYRESMAGFSIPASEHSVMTSWGGRDGEPRAMKNMIEQFGGAFPLIACVSDSYDVFNAAENIWGGQLLEDVKASRSTIVVRPDSGDPVETPVRVIEILMEKAGHTVNSKGFKMLPDFFRVIQGDGIDEATIEKILRTMKARGLSADNIAFGMGGALLQKMDRDTSAFAMKCSSIEIDGKWEDVYKDPVTQSSKRSKRGRLELVKTESGYETKRKYEVGGWKDDAISWLELVYRDGALRQTTDLAEIRERVDRSL